MEALSRMRCHLDIMSERGSDEASQHNACRREGAEHIEGREVCQGGGLCVILGP